MERDLLWDGCFNVRDLGGLRTADGRRTRWGAVVRADSLDRLSAAGWSALVSHGIRTIVDLRNDDEVVVGGGVRPAGISTVRVPLDDTADTALWHHLRDNELDGTPMYYRPFLERKPQRCAPADAAVARTRPGGVVVHCGAGRDRTGLVIMLLLALAGVGAEDIAADYELSNERLHRLWGELGVEDQGVWAEGALARAGTTTRGSLLATLGWLDAERCLLAAGLTAEDLAAVRARLVERG